MRSVSVIPVCVALMVLVFARAAGAETPLGTPLSADQRFEFPEPGIAVSLPDSYLLDRQATPSLPIFESVIAAAPVDGPGECTIETFAFAGQEPNKVAETLGLIADYPEFMIEERYGGLDALPGGDYVLMSAEYAPGGEPGASAAYVFPTPTGYAWLWCSTTESPPEDLWRSIAETVEFLSAEE